MQVPLQRRAPSPGWRHKPKLLFPATQDPSLFLPEVIVRLIEPILPRRIENIHIERIFQGFGLVEYVRRDNEDLARAYRYLFHLLADPELQSAAQDIGQLFVFMRVLR